MFLVRSGSPHPLIMRCGIRGDDWVFCLKTDAEGQQQVQRADDFRLEQAADQSQKGLGRVGTFAASRRIEKRHDGLTVLHTTGGLDPLFELAATLQTARSALTDDVIERLYHFLETMANNLATLEVADRRRQGW